MSRLAQFRTWIILVMLGGSLIGCRDFIADMIKPIFPPGCPERYPQKYKFGRYPITISIRRTDLRVGDTIFVSARYSQHFFDSLSQQVVGVNEKVAVWLKMDQVKSTPASVGSFAIDTTIINVFDQHFRVVMRKGTPVNAYRYSFQRVKDSWELDMLYIARKSGSYTVSTSFHQILTGENTRCMLGNVSTYGGSTYFQSTNNQISRIYPIVTSHNNATNLFGFIVDN